MLAAYALTKRKKFSSAREILNTLRGEYRQGKIAVDIQELNVEFYEAQNQLDTAAFLYRQVIADDTRRGRAHWGLGRFYLGKEETAKAQTEFEEVTQLWPKHVSSRFNLALIAMGQENFTEAARWLGECNKLDRADPGVLEQMGILFERKGMISEAVKYWQKAVDLNKEAPLAKRKLAQYSGDVVDSMIKSGQWEAALAKLESSEKNLRSDPKYLFKRGVVYRNLGRWEKAAADLAIFVKTNPDDPTAQRELGISYLNLMLWDQAGRALAKAVEKEPEKGMN